MLTSSEFKHTDPRNWLISEFSNKRQINPAYSIRAFSRRLEIAPSALAEIIRGVRPLTVKAATKIVDRLNLDPIERKRFLETVKLTSQNKTKLLHKKDAPTSIDFHDIDADAFFVIADAYHYSILNLMNTINFRSDVRWIAKRLKLSVAEVRGGLERLCRVGIIKKNSDGYVRVLKNIRINSKVPSAALRRSHKQSLEHAIRSIEDTPIESRDITSLTLAIDPKKMKDARELIAEFRSRFISLMEAGDKKEVYNLNIQFVPLTSEVL